MIMLGRKLIDDNRTLPPDLYMSSLYLSSHSIDVVLTDDFNSNFARSTAGDYTCRYSTYS